MTEELFHIETRQKADALFSVPSQDAVIPGPGVPTPPRPTLLGVGQTFTSPVREVDGYSSIALIVLSDQPFQVRIQESNTPTGPVGQTSVTVSTLDGISFLQKVVLRVTPVGSFMTVLVDNLGAQQRTFLLTGLGIPVAGSGSSASSGGAPSTSTFILFSADPSLPNSRVITAGANITITDGGPGGTLTISATGGGGSLEQARAVGDTFTGGSVFWDNQNAAVFGKASGEANQDYLQIYSDKVNSLQVIDSTKDGAGVVRPISVQTGGIEKMRLLATGELLVGATALISTEMVLVRRDANSGTTVRCVNLNSGAAAGASFAAQGDTSKVNFGHSSSTYDGAAAGNGLLANEGYVATDSTSTSLALMTTGAQFVRIGTNKLERVRILATGEVIIGATTLTGTEQLKVVGDVYFTGKLTVDGAIDPTSVSLSDPAAGTELFFDSADGGTAPVSAAGHARIRYADPTGWEQSINGAAYVALGGSGSSPLQLVERYVVPAGAGVTSKTFSSLDGDVDETYLIKWRVGNNFSGHNTYFIRPNAVTTNLKQVAEYGIYGSTNPGGYTQTDWLAGDVNSGAGGEPSTGHMYIFAQTGLVRTHEGQACDAENASPIRRVFSGAWNDSATNITSLQFISSVSSGIAPGSVIELYKLKG